MVLKMVAKTPYNFLDLFRLCPPSLVSAYYLQPPDARAIFLHNDLLCNDTCSVTGGSITYWGGAQTEKIQFFSQVIFISPLFLSSETRKGRC